MPSAKIAITLPEELLAELDARVAEGAFPNRSRAVARAVAEMLERLGGSRLSREAAKLDPDFEQAMAEEDPGGDVDAWPAS